MRIHNLRPYEGGPRHFASFDATISPSAFADHIRQLEGVHVEELLQLGTSWEDAGFDFTFREHRFGVNCHWGNTYHVFSDDDDAAEDDLIAIAEHCAAVLPLAEDMQRLQSQSD
jgi:hypothetical protein